MDTPNEETVLSFKDSICKSYKPFDDWFLAQSSVTEDTGLIFFPDGTQNFIF